MFLCKIQCFHSCWPIKACLHSTMFPLYLSHLLKLLAKLVIFHFAEQRAFCNLYFPFHFNLLDLCECFLF
ncbi:hypothetical protein RJT34_00941 [Clitoria ternatea]|uniref:Uncharacterized protein n=1 Tax=Clitoria ternatea TaxID=43366 RepID=A0AAN9KGB3_CLITE